MEEETVVVNLTPRSMLLLEEAEEEMEDIVLLEEPEEMVLLEEAETQVSVSACLKHGGVSAASC